MLGNRNRGRIGGYSTWLAGSLTAAGGGPWRWLAGWGLAGVYPMGLDWIEPKLVFRQLQKRQTDTLVLVARKKTA